MIRAAVLLAAFVFLQTPVRDGAASTSRGSAVIAGRLVSGSDSHTPIRRARVTLRAVDSSWTDTTVSDDNGQFRFDRLASGPYRLTATKPAFLRASYGETQPNRAGVALALADGQQLTTIVMPMWKGAVIAGTIRDASGEPAAHVEVHVVGRAVGRTVWTREEFAMTDDHGRYRIFGLLPGEYVVASTPRSLIHGSLTETTSASVRWAESMLRSPSSAVPAPPNPGTVGYANVFYPGTTDEADATVLTLAPGDERVGIDLQIQHVTVGSVEGTVIDPSGRPVENVELFMTPTTGVILAFSSLFESFSTPSAFRGVPPGEYVIIARTTGPSHGGLAAVDIAVRAGVAGVEVATSQQPKSGAMWATTTVSTSGRDVTGVVLTLQPTISVTGRIAFDASSRTPPDFTDLRLALTAVPGSQRLSVGAGTATIAADGSFTINGLVPGR
jgi:protocatechuate 3,4-dioxygenase beta subunit